MEYERQIKELETEKTLLRQLVSAFEVLTLITHRTNSKSQRNMTLTLKRPRILLI